jgi:carbon-monoxide dehydrogenase small subunit
MADRATALEWVPVSITVNGVAHAAVLQARMLLVHFLREELGLTGTHVGCVVGRCGACTVLLDGEPVKSCMVLGVRADGAEVVTVEGLQNGNGLHPLQEAFWEHDAVECGYCTPGMLLAAHGLLRRNPDPSDADILEAISGNLCRCTGYVNIMAAIRSCAAHDGDAAPAAPDHPVAPEGA